MFETIKTSSCPKAPLQVLGNRLMDGVLIATILFSLVPTVWANPYDNSDIVAALSTSQTVPPEAQDLASSFVDHALPRLLTNDVRVAKQLGFDQTRGSTLALEQPMPLMIIFLDDILGYVLGRSNPVDLVNNTNNWIKDPAGKLVPRRMIFSLKVSDGASESGPYTWSSITVENLPSGSSRLLQVGAPKLARAMKLYEAPYTIPFLLWIPDLNRHYLGQLKLIEPPLPLPQFSIILTVLFDDPLARRGAGEQIDVTSADFIQRLIGLYQGLSQNPPLSRR